MASCAWVVNSPPLLVRLTASVKVSVMFLDASVTVVLLAGLKVGADGPVVSASCGVPVPCAQAPAPSPSPRSRRSEVAATCNHARTPLFARTRTR